MSDKYIITKEEIKQILLHSPFALSTTPSKNGMSGEQIKKYFYDFIPVLVEKLNLRMNDVEGAMDEASSRHESAEEALNKLVDEIWVSINNLGADIEAAMDKATGAYNLASGKSRVHVYGDARNLFGDILDSLNTPAKDFQIGDFILIMEKTFPDFVVCSIPDNVKAPPEGFVEINADNYLTLELTAGTTYAFLNGFSLVGIESGIDTSEFVTESTFRNVTNGIDSVQAYHSKRIEEAENKLETVESIAKGANRALTFTTYATMTEHLLTLPNTELIKGQNIYLENLNVPDLWVSDVSSNFESFEYSDDDYFISGLKNFGSLQIGYYWLSALETQKVDLTKYATKEELEGKNKYRIIFDKTLSEEEVWVEIPTDGEGNALNLKKVFILVLGKCINESVARGKHIEFHGVKYVEFCKAKYIDFAIGQKYR